MSRPVICCTPWDPVWSAAMLMKTHGVGVLPVVSDISDPLLEGIITDRDLCCAVVAGPKAACPVHVADVMTRVPVISRPHDTLEQCQKLMRENQVRRIPVVNERARCIGIVTQRDIARHCASKELAETMLAICGPPRSRQELQFDENYLYCGKLNESDQTALLNRRGELASMQEVLR